MERHGDQQQQQHQQDPGLADEARQKPADQDAGSADVASRDLREALSAYLQEAAEVELWESALFAQHQAAQRAAASEALSRLVLQSDVLARLLLPPASLPPTGLVADGEQAAATGAASAGAAADVSAAAAAMAAAAAGRAGAAFGSEALPLEPAEGTSAEPRADWGSVGAAAEGAAALQVPVGAEVAVGGIAGLSSAAAVLGKRRVREGDGAAAASSGARDGDCFAAVVAYPGAAEALGGGQRCDSARLPNVEQMASNGVRSAASEAGAVGSGAEAVGFGDRSEAGGAARTFAARLAEQLAASTVRHLPGLGAGPGSAFPAGTAPGSVAQDLQTLLQLLEATGASRDGQLATAAAPEAVKGGSLPSADDGVGDDPRPLAEGPRTSQDVCPLVAVAASPESTGSPDAGGSTAAAEAYDTGSRSALIAACWEAMERYAPLPAAERDGAAHECGSEEGAGEAEAEEGESTSDEAQGMDVDAAGGEAHGQEQQPRGEGRDDGGDGGGSGGPHPPAAALLGLQAHLDRVAASLIKRTCTVPQSDALAAAYGEARRDALQL